LRGPTLFSERSRRLYGAVGGERPESERNQGKTGDGWGRKDWLLISGLLGLVVLVFANVLFTRKWSFGVELDFLRQFYPARFFEARSLAQGTFPLWSPYILSGHPFYASFQTALLYPFNLAMVGVYGLTGAQFPLRAQNAFVVFHFWLAGTFTYILARDLKIGRAGSTVAALTFMFSGFMVAHAGHINQHSAAAWMPLIFLLFNRSLVRRKAPYALAAGAAMGVALLAGHLQSVFYLCVVLLGLVVLRAFQHRDDKAYAGLFLGLASLALTVAVAAGLAAVQLLPTYELIGLSTRSKIPYDIAVTASLPRWQTVNLLFPHFFGASPQNYVGGWLMWETYGYSGIVGAVLGVVALIRKPRAFAVFLWITLLVALLLALGPSGYLWTGLFKLGLLFNRFRDPARVLVIYGFASALLAGLGADYLVSASGPHDKDRYRNAFRVASVVVLAIILVAVALLIFVLVRGPRPHGANGSAMLSMITPILLAVSLLLLMLIAGRAKRPKRWLSVGLVVLIAVDLIAMNTIWILVNVNPDDIYGDKAASGYISAQPGPFRVETDANTMYPAFDDGAIYALEKASGDDSLVLEDFYRYRELMIPQQSPGVQVGLFYSGGVRSELLDVLNDTYFITEDRMHPLLARGKFELAARRGKVYIYRNKTAMPRAWMSDALAFNDNEAVFTYLKATRGEGLRSTALVVYPQGMPPAQPASGGEPAGETGVPIPAVKGSVSVVSRSIHQLTLQTAPTCKGLLVVSEIYYPGWQVYVDGKKKEILPTDMILRGVMLQGGQKRVEFRFSPDSLRKGMIISLATLGLLVLYSLILIARGLYRRKKKQIEAVGDSAGLQ
jgi:hypothetical protein